MKKMLQDAGLDPDCWMKHFKNIKVTTPEALKHCGPEEFDKLSKTCTSIEEKALRKLFGIPDEAKVGFLSHKYDVVHKIVLLSL